MSCLQLSRCFGRKRPSSDQQQQLPTEGYGGGGVTPAPVSGNSLTRLKPYQDLSYEVPSVGVQGYWAPNSGELQECKLGEDAPEKEQKQPEQPANADRGSSFMDRLRKLCTREKTPEELEIELLRKEKKEILKALKTYGLDGKRVTLANMKELRAAVEQSLEQERKKSEEPLEMQEIKSGSTPAPKEMLETNLDGVDYPLTQPDPVLGK